MHCVCSWMSEIQVKRLLGAKIAPTYDLTDARRRPSRGDCSTTAINAMKLLHIDSSILGEGSVSRQLTAKLVSAARSKHRDVQVTYRDLVAQPVGHLTGAHLAAAQGDKPESTALQQDVSAGLND